MQANLHYNRPRVPQISRAFLVLYCRHLHDWSELKRGNEVELADLTRGMRKNDPPWSLRSCFFAKPGLSEFHFRDWNVFSRERLRRVLRKKAAVVNTSADLHLHTFTSADLHLHTFTSADLHLHTFTSADLHYSHFHICRSTSSHLQICRSTSSHLHICRSTTSHLHTCRSTSSHLRICRSSLSLPFFLSLFFLSLGAAGAPRNVTGAAFRAHRTSKTKVKLRFWGVRRNPFTRNGCWTSKAVVKLWFWGVRRNPFARNGCWTSKTAVKLRFWGVRRNLFVRNGC